MEKFYYEVPTIKRKNDAINYINEHYECNSNINGVGGLYKYLDNYEGWLEKLENDYNTIPSEERVPSRTYFLIRESDDRIIGMINIRTALNERLKKNGGNIGYGIRPTERGKGYNKINLYLGLKVCDRFGLDNVLLDADVNNPASWKTMEALGGKRINKHFDSFLGQELVDYEINVKDSLKKFSEIYEPLVSDER